MSLIFSFILPIFFLSLIVACCVGDGEAETGPLATSWQLNKFINPKTDGVVLPILHLNGYKISNPTVLARISNQELKFFFYGCGWRPIIVEVDDTLDVYEKHERMAAALEDSLTNIDKRIAYVTELRDTLLGLLLNVDGAHLNGGMGSRIASNINIRFDNVSAQDLVMLCDINGICISGGSACNEGNATPSHALKAIGLSDAEALNSVRMTLSTDNTMDEIYYTANIIKQLIKRLRTNN